MTIKQTVSGVILAGGRATRMGGQDKGLVEVAGRAMVSHIVDALRPQVGEVVINANRNQDRYAELTGCRVVSDDIEDFAGPLAGMVSAMHACNTSWLLSVPCDSPIVASDLASRLMSTAANSDAEICVARDAERMQPVFALIATHLETSMRAYLQAGERKIDRWYKQHKLQTCDFSDAASMFANVNTPSDRDVLDALLQGSRKC